MPEKLEVLDLPADLSHNVQTADLLPVQDLHCHLVLGQLMLANCRMKQNEQMSNTNYNAKYNPTIQDILCHKREDCAMPYIVYF